MKKKKQKNRSIKKIQMLVRKIRRRRRKTDRNFGKKKSQGVVEQVFESQKFSNGAIKKKEKN